MKLRLIIYYLLFNLIGLIIISKEQPNLDLVLLLLYSLIFFNLVYLIQDKFQPLIITLFIILCFTNNNFIYFLPLLCYVLKLKNPYNSLLFIPLILIKLTSWDYLFILNLSILSALSNYIIIKNINLKHINTKTKLNLNHELELYRLKMVELHDNYVSSKQQDILLERNRIAHDIHDNVGYLLSSSLLFTAKLKVDAANTPMVDELRTLEKILDQAMTSIRNSVHQMNREAINFESNINLICDSF
ncbi:MAG: histidine kinase dimerization/phosphoacceptor domain-containing protein, partial [Bacilli bacterium]